VLGACAGEWTEGDQRGGFSMICVPQAEPFRIGAEIAEEIKDVFSLFE
jgi:hypothetical protein